MTGETAERPWARIDAAMARIEAAATNGSSRDVALERRQAVLRDSMASAIAALDALIAEPDDR